MSARTDERNSVQAWMHTIQVNRDQEFAATMQVSPDTVPMHDTEDDELPPVVQAMAYGISAAVASIAIVAAVVLVVFPWLADRVLR